MSKCTWSFMNVVSPWCDLHDWLAVNYQGQNQPKWSIFHVIQDSCRIHRASSSGHWHLASISLCVITTSSPFFGSDERLFFSLYTISSNRSDQSLGRWDARDDSAEVLFLSFLRDAIVSGSGRDKNVHSLTWSVLLFLGRSRRHSILSMKTGPSTFFYRTMSVLFSVYSSAIVLWQHTCTSSSTDC